MEKTANEAGKHQELMRKDGLYKSLFLKQQLENEA